MTNKLEYDAISRIFNDTKHKIEQECPNILTDPDFKSGFTTLFTTFDTLPAQIQEKNNMLTSTDYQLRQSCISVGINTEQIDTMVQMLIPFCNSQQPSSEHINSLIKILQPLETFKIQLGNFSISDVPTRVNDFAIFNCCEKFFVDLKTFYCAIDWKNLQNILNYLHDTAHLKHLIDIKSLCDSNLFASENYYSSMSYGELQVGAKIHKRYDWVSMDTNPADNTVYLNGIVTGEQHKCSTQQALDFYDQHKNLEIFRSDTRKLRRNLSQLHKLINHKFNIGYNHMKMNLNKIPLMSLKTR